MRDSEVIAIVLCTDHDQTHFVSTGRLYVCVGEKAIGGYDGWVVIGDDGNEHHLYKRRFKTIIEP